MAPRSTPIESTWSTNTHWSVDGVILKSDWGGAESFLVDDVDALCEGLDPEVVSQSESSSRDEGVQRGLSSLAR